MKSTIISSMVGYIYSSILFELDKNGKNVDENINNLYLRKRFAVRDSRNAGNLEIQRSLLANGPSGPSIGNYTFYVIMGMVAAVFVLMCISYAILVYTHHDDNEEDDNEEIEHDEFDETWFDEISSCIWHKISLWLHQLFIKSKSFFGIEDFYPQFDFQKKYGDCPWQSATNPCVSPEHLNKLQTEKNSFSKNSDRSDETAAS